MSNDQGRHSSPPPLYIYVCSNCMHDPKVIYMPRISNFGSISRMQTFMLMAVDQIAYGC